MKTHWLSAICYAKDERKYIGPGCWYPYIKRQANKQVRRNAQFYIDEGLDEVFLSPEDERAHTEWERAEQTQLMNEYQHVLRTALDFACRRIDYHEDKQSYYEDDAVWRDADNELVAYSEWTGIDVMPDRHDFVWKIFEMFL